MPQLVFQLSPLIATDLAADKPQTSAARAVARAVQSVGGTATQLHPGTTDSALAGYFIVELPDPEAATRLANKLGHMPSVEAAYVKPDDAPPGG